MFTWMVIFLGIALVAGVIGFGGLVVAASGIAKTLFVVFLALFIVSLAAGRGWL